MIMEAVGGGWGPTAIKVFYDFAKTKATLTGETTNIALNHIYQNLGIRFHRENARAILRRCAPVPIDASILLAATTLSVQDADPNTLSQIASALQHLRTIAFPRVQLCWQMVCRIETLREFPSILMG